MRQPAYSGRPALDVTAINLTFQQATGGIVITPSGGDTVYYKFSSSAATNHVNANGTADVGFDVWYKLPNQGSEGLATVAFSYTYTDKSSNEYTYSSTKNVKVGKRPRRMAITPDGSAAGSARITVGDRVTAAPSAMAMVPVGGAHSGRGAPLAVAPADALPAASSAHTR